ncbi:MAG: hypothetical protein QW606_00795, partial [Conexivisphaerales archaeon]
QLWSCGKLFLAGRKKSSWSYRSLKYLFNTADYCFLIQSDGFIIIKYIKPSVVYYEQDSSV